MCLTDLQPSCNIFMTHTHTAHARGVSTCAPLSACVCQKQTKTEKKTSPQSFLSPYTAIPARVAIQAVPKRTDCSFLTPYISTTEMLADVCTFVRGALVQDRPLTLNIAPPPTKKKGFYECRHPVLPCKPIQVCRIFNVCDLVYTRDSPFPKSS